METHSALLFEELNCSTNRQEEASPALVSKTKIEKRQMGVHLIASVNRQGKKLWILPMDSNMEMEISSFLVPMITLPLVQMLTSGLDPLVGEPLDR
ncbi:hypothetical protein Q3G72_026411 [Acer saccharum]|nr:hypothetical protein Q3G72_026411 [Acer saccharum]